jgi:hypothetical protein
MFSELKDGLEPETKIDASLVNELARNTPENIAAQRRHARLTVTGKMSALSADVDLDDCVAGVAVDVSAGGCMGVFTKPPRVGNVYRIRLESAEARIPVTFARCLRVRLLREDAFEAGFAFFVPAEIELEQSLAA